MTHRTLIVRVPLTDTDPDNIIDMIDEGELDPTVLIVDRENTVEFVLEVA